MISLALLEVYLYIGITSCDYKITYFLGKSNMANCINSTKTAYAKCRFTYIIYNLC